MNTIHASAVLIGATAVLIRGPSGAGKSALAWDLLEAGRTHALPFVRLVADDRSYVEACAGRLLVRPAPALAGLLEVRGLGIRRLDYESVAAVGLIVDLTAAKIARLPEPAACEAAICGITLPRLAVAPGLDALRLVLASRKTGPACD
jgi:serine kinase of HPr protein (carbohydrate metabolism regulator)